MRRILKRCEDYAKEYSILFNAKKSKVIVSAPGGVTKSASLVRNPVFYIGGSVVEYVDQWPHLGHLFTSNRDDKSDILHFAIKSTACCAILGDGTPLPRRG